MRISILSGISRINLCVLLVMSLFGCSTIKEIRFTSEKETVSIGDEINLKYLTNPSDAKTDDIQISLSDDSFVMQEDEQYFAGKEGTITASLIYKDEVYDTKIIEILPIYCREIYTEDVSLGVGRQSDIKVQYYPENCTHKDYSLISADESVVKTFGDKIIAVSEGETSITIKSVDGAESDFTVYVHPVEADQIRISGINDTYVVGSTDIAEIVFEPKDVTNQIVAFSSSNNKILSIDKDGTLSAKYPGEVTITAKYSNDVYDSKTVTVKYPPVSSITASTYYSTLYVGNRTTVRITYEPQKVDDYSIRYSSSNEKVATVDEKGVITGISAGTAIITAKSANNKTSKVEIEIKEQPAQTISRSNNSGSGSGTVSSSGTMVWIPRTGSKYHYRESCSNMKKPSYVTLEYAISHGYTACKKCAGG